jgi:hypothetical protein
MKKKTAKAKITWLSLEEGGRKKPPTGPQYATVVHFEDDKTDWPKTTRSLVLEFDRPPNESKEIVATVWLLAYDHPKAPNHLLQRKSQFELLEGSQVVALGEILD